MCRELWRPLVDQNEDTESGRSLVMAVVCSCGGHSVVVVFCFCGGRSGFLLLCFLSCGELWYPIKCRTERDIESCRLLVTALVLFSLGSVLIVSCCLHCVNFARMFWSVCLSFFVVDHVLF